MKKSEDLMSEEQVLTDSESVGLFRGSGISENYRRRNTVHQYTIIMEFVEKFNNGTTVDKCRDDCLMYLRNIYRMLDSELTCRRWGSAEKYDHTRSTGGIMRAMTSTG